MMTSRASQNLFNKFDRILVSRLLNSEIQNALVSKRSTLLSFKIANRYKYSVFYT